jgi:hypothetical protein
MAALALNQCREQLSKMSDFDSIIFTRDQLKGLKAESDRINHNRNVQHFVQDIRNNILAIARSSNKTSYYRSYKLPDNKEDPNYLVVTDAINVLKQQFVDISIEYKFQTDIRTGKEFNHGIYIDWS